jgi:glycosyltransferase involved in cell wall biosynthesis
LVTDDRLRFDPDDDARLRTLLERCVTDDDFRAGTVAAQTSMGQKFRSRTVADTIWSAVAMHLAPLPKVIVGGRKPRLAILTLLPPAKSGIADYSARLGASFGERVAVEMFAAAVAPGAKTVSALPCLSARFDRVVCIVGNSPQHKLTLDLLMKYGGACICHDSRLYGLMLSKFGAEGAALIASRELRRSVTAAEITAWNGDEMNREADFFECLAHAARPLIFHARHTAEKVTARFGKRAWFLPFALYRPWEPQLISAAARMAARDRLGIARDVRMIASFGFIHGSKGIDAALRALALLHERGLAYQLYWIGQNHQDTTKFEALAEALGVAPNVHFTNRFFVDAAYRDYLLAADFGLQLRIGARGNISGALADCIAAGLPTVASRDLAENIEAPNFVKRVADLPDPTDIAAAFISLAQSEASQMHWIEERLDYCERHSMTNYAKGLCEILGL